MEENVIVETKKTRIPKRRKTTTTNEYKFLKITRTNFFLATTWKIIFKLEFLLCLIIQKMNLRICKSCSVSFVIKNLK